MLFVVVDVRPGVAVVAAERGVRAAVDGGLVVLEDRPAAVSAVRRGPVGVVRPDTVPTAAARLDVDNDSPPLRRAGDDVVRDMTDDIDLDADDDVGAE